MSECWAAPLGDCVGKLSREHIITEGLLPQAGILIQGFPWCLDGPAKIGTANLTSKILCVKHNSLLSTADDAGIAMVTQFREFFRLGNVRSGMKSRRWHRVRLTTKGLELERWFLKTLINVAFGHKYPMLKPDEAKHWRPSLNLVEIAFGLTRFEPRAGLYLIGGNVGDTINVADKLQITTIRSRDDRRLVGASFTISSFRFVIYLKPDGLNRNIERVGMDGEVTPESNLLYHPRAINFTTQPGNWLSHSLDIAWQ